VSSRIKDWRGEFESSSTSSAKAIAETLQDPFHFELSTVLKSFVMKKSKVAFNVLEYLVVQCQA
jgi:hypothetical protein